MFVENILSKIRAYQRHRQTIRELIQFSNRELEDLGISRYEIGVTARQDAVRPRSVNRPRPEMDHGGMMGGDMRAMMTMMEHCNRMMQSMTNQAPQTPPRETPPATPPARGANPATTAGVGSPGSGHSF